MEAKQAAALRALEEVRDGMLLGLGTGSTARYFIDGLGARVRDGLRVTAVATSRATEAAAREWGIEIVEHVDRELDLTVDGADEIDPDLNLLKGLGGALLREKVVAAASHRMVVIATADKLVPALGRGPVPVEVLPLLWERTAAQVEALGLSARLREEGDGPFLSDNGNYTLHCSFEAPRRLHELAAQLSELPGVLGHGLFLGLASEAVVADSEGKVRIVRPGLSLPA
jgi:ribose 5-phosphate isomerase A